jgi:hypothetical protein
MAASMPANSNDELNSASEVRHQSLDCVHLHSISDLGEGLDSGVAIRERGPHQSTIWFACHRSRELHTPCQSVHSCFSPAEGYPAGETQPCVAMQASILPE